MHGGHKRYHGVEAGPSSIGVIMKSRRHKADRIRETDIEEIRRVWFELYEAAEQLQQAVTDAVGLRIRPRLLGLVDEHGNTW